MEACFIPDRVYYDFLFIYLYLIGYNIMEGNLTLYPLGCKIYMDLCKGRLSYHE